MKLNADKTIAALSAPSQVNAQELDNLLHDLALLRAEMTPAVAKTRAQLPPDSRALVEDKPSMVISQRSGGDFSLWVRHSGFGWLCFLIDGQTAAGLSSFINNRTDAEVRDLILHQGRNLH